jgi:hypothetical protein
LPLVILKKQKWTNLLSLSKEPYLFPVSPTSRIFVPWALSLHLLNHLQSDSIICVVYTLVLLKGTHSFPYLYNLNTRVLMHSKCWINVNYCLGNDLRQPSQNEFPEHNPVKCCPKKVSTIS